MLKKNNFFFGFSLALLVTGIIFGLMYLASVPLHSAFSWFTVSEGTMITTGLSVNLIVINYYLNHKLNNTARGIMVLFLLGAAYVVYRFYIMNT